MDSTPQINIYKEIPDYGVLREIKKAGYLDQATDTSHPLYNEELVPISRYGVAGTGYYSRPNRVTTDPLPGINPTVFVRESIAEKLAAANDYLAVDTRIAEILGGEVELDVRDGYRSLQLQNELYETYYPAHLRRLNEKNAPGEKMTEEEMATRRDAIIAKGDARSPHVSGGVIDLNLKYKGTDTAVFNAQGANISKEAVNPEYLEYIQRSREQGIVMELPEEIERLSESEFYQALMARRVLYNVLVSPEVGGLSLTVNPNETWHFGAGDTLSAFVLSHTTGITVPAYYGAAVEPAEYRTGEVSL